MFQEGNDHPKRWESRNYRRKRLGKTEVLWLKMLVCQHTSREVQRQAEDGKETPASTNKTRKRLVPFLLQNWQNAHTSVRNKGCLNLLGIREIEQKIIRYYFMNYKKFRTCGPSSQARCRGKAGFGPGQDCDLAPVAEQHICTAGLLGECMHTR